MVDQSLTGVSGVTSVADGDRSVRARAVILALVGVLILTALLSLASGASDASPVGVMSDWLFGPSAGADALSARDRIDRKSVV